MCVYVFGIENKVERDPVQGALNLSGGVFAAGSVARGPFHPGIPPTFSPGPRGTPLFYLISDISHVKYTDPFE